VAAPAGICPGMPRITDVLFSVVCKLFVCVFDVFSGVYLFVRVFVSRIWKTVTAVTVFPLSC